MEDYLAKFSSTHLDGKEQKRRELSILMANLHVRSILMSALLLGVLFSGVTIEKSQLNYQDSNKKKQVLDYGYNNTTTYIKSMSDVLDNIGLFESNNGIIIHSTEINPTGGLILGGHVSSSKVITTDGGDYTTTECQIFLMKININQSIAWIVNITHEGYPNSGHDCYSQSYNKRSNADDGHESKWITEILVSDTGNIHVFGTVCHYDVTPVCDAFNSSLHGFTPFTAKYDTNGHLVYVKLFPQTLSNVNSGNGDRLDIGYSASFLGNQSEVVFAIRYSMLSGRMSLDIDGETCTLRNLGDRLCTWIVHLNDTGDFLNVKMHKVGNSIPILWNADVRITTDGIDKVFYSFDKEADPNFRIWNTSSDVITTEPKLSFYDDMDGSNSCSISSCPFLPIAVGYDASVNLWSTIWQNYTTTKIVKFNSTFSETSRVYFNGSGTAFKQETFAPKVGYSIENGKHHVLLYDITNVNYNNSANTYSGNILFRLEANNSLNLVTNWQDSIQQYEYDIPIPLSVVDGAILVEKSFYLPNIDGDNHADIYDDFPFDNTQWEDADGDGYGDNPSGDNPDGCISQFGNSTEDAFGCPDYDGDGYSNNGDQFPGFASQWNDSDWDGYGDNINGYQGDACPTVLGTSNRNETGAINAEDATFGCPDDDFDGYANIIDDCITNYGDSAYSIEDGINQTYVGCPDADNDKYEDSTDPCPLQYGTSWLDRLGCADLDEDGISDLRDPKPTSATSDSEDWDEDGHMDLRNWTNADGLQYWINGTDVFPDNPFEWSDLDDDGVGDNSDAFPNDATETADTDGDSIGDVADQCPYAWGNATEGDAAGCLDSDGDGWADQDDAFSSNPSEWLDSDGDGIGDNSDWAPEDDSETRDTDGDGVGDNADTFPNNENETADSDGDGVGDNADVFPNDESEYADFDQDGVGDNADAFPNNANETTDSDGDGIGDNADWAPNDDSETRDTDEDGVGDNADVFPNNANETADSDGDGVGDNADWAPLNQAESKDSDADGVGDNADMFPNNANETLDSDGDGVGDNADVFRFDPTETMDSDLDGVGDNADAFPDDLSETTDSDGDMIGDNADQCPSQSGDLFTIPIGCPDTDRDGYADSNDRFFTDPSEWNDSDEDGLGDNSDYCPNQDGNATLGFGLGCIDSDGDGWADLEDIWPSNAKAWSDGDGDMFTDQPGLVFSDDCPSQNGSSNISMNGCGDMDNDGIPDMLDPDADGDGIFNTWEYQMDPMTDPFNATSVPADNDKDGIPDIFDEDDDNDGFPDTLEEERGSNPYDDTDDPLNQYGGGVYYLPGDGFSTQYDPEGVELSFGAFLSLLSSEFLAPLLIAPITIYFLLSKRRRFNRMKIDIEESNDLAELELYEEEINDYISGNKLKITHSLLLRNILEHQQDMLRGHTAIEHHVEPEEKEVPDLAYATVRESPSDVPHPGLSGTVGKDGYEYIKWPEDDPVDWYRKANSGDVWLRWEKY